MENILIAANIINSIIQIYQAYKRIPPKKSKYQTITKVLICPLLVIYFIIHMKNKNGKLTSDNLFLAYGLILGALGDFLLEFRKQIIFLSGLVSFLVGHIMYCISIYKWMGGIKEFNTYIITQITLDLIYFSYFYQVYYKQMKKEMIVPAFIYGCFVFLFNGIAFYSLFMNFSLKTISFVLCSALFCYSDSILSMHMFIKPIKKADVYIMVSYMLAQFFVMLGGIL